MSAVLLAGLLLVSYALAAWPLDRVAHDMVHPVVGNGYPLKGRRRWVVRMFSPLIVVVVILVCAPIGILAVLAVAAQGRR